MKVFLIYILLATKKDKRLWHVYSHKDALSNSWNIEVPYFCNIACYEHALEAYNLYAKTGNCDDYWRDITQKGNRIYKKGKVIVCETSDPSYLAWHPTILPKEILIGAIGSDCWSVPIALRYKKPVCEPVVIDTGTLSSLGIDPSSTRFASIVKLVNSKNIQGKLPNVSKVTPIATIFPTVKEKEQSLVVSPSLNFLVYSTIELKGVEGNNTLLVYDHNKVDGDTVSIFINGTMYQSHVAMTGKPIEVPFTLAKGEKCIIGLKAESEGSISPCTVTLKVLGGSDKKIVMEGKKGQIMSLVVTR